MSTVKERLQQFLKSERITQSEFARQLGVSPAYVGAIRKSLPPEKISRIVELYPSLNRDWLLYGEGDMKVETPQSIEEVIRSEENEYLVPLLPVEAYAGGLQAYSQSIALAQCRWIGVPVKGAEMAIPVKGDSMEPKIQNGTIVAIRRINERAFIPWGYPLIIDSENGILIKVVLPSKSGKSYITAHSYNPDYPDIDIPLSSVYGLYSILAYSQVNGAM